MTIRTALAASFMLAGGAMAGCSSGPDGSALGQVPADQPAASSRVGSDGADGVTIRRVWPEHDAGFYASSISPDGRHLSMIDWSTSNLAVRDLSTGELHRLTNVRNEKGRPPDRVLAGKLRGEIWTMDGIALTGEQPAQKETGR